MKKDDYYCKEFWKEYGFVSCFECDEIFDNLEELFECQEIHLKEESEGLKGI